MATVHVLGKILPNEPRISVRDTPTLDWVWEEKNFSFRFKIAIVDSQIDVECSLPEYRSEFLGEIHRRSFDLVRAAVNLVAFSSGYGLTVRLDEFIDPDGRKTALLPEDKRLPPLASALEGEGAFATAYSIVAQNPTLNHLLGELIHAITVPHEASTSCAVAIDGLKNVISGDEVSDKAAWEKMRSVLRVDESYLKFITENSKDSRHGKGVRIEGVVTGEVVIRSWAVMNRFLEYEKRKRVPLPEREFPTLK